ncbi:hypothetical protein C8F01DRAFT_1249719 [Mycena amicta]|nr:hypothetical protein C8F01DRAFT_1249719 [Mycena amicta]
MQLKSLLLPLILIASGANAAAATHVNRAVGTNQLSLAGRSIPRAAELQLLAESARAVGNCTDDPGSDLPPPINCGPGGTGETECNWCECLLALSGEGVACAAAILEGGCNILADISCILDYEAAALAAPKCIACLRSIFG